RDGNRCQTPGCRSTYGLEIHHVVHREHGGTHHPSNLTLRCSSCHAAHHAGQLTIRGIAPDQLITERHEPIKPRAAARTEATVADDARQALVTLGFRPSIARAAVAEAMGHVAHGTSLEDMIREALRRCPNPRV